MLLVLIIAPGRVFALSWMDQMPDTAATDIFYDFRPTIGGMPNQITPAEANVAVAALNFWSGVSNVHFVQNAWAPSTAILNIGMSSIDGPWNVVGQGGYTYTNAGGTWHISSGFVLLDASEQWDLSIGGNTPGTLNLFTVAAHEIGHALGLGHTDNPSDIMYPYYTGAKMSPSANDLAGLQSLYGGVAVAGESGVTGSLTAVPEPGSATLFGLGLLATAWSMRRTGRRPSA